MNQKIEDCSARLRSGRAVAPRRTRHHTNAPRGARARGIVTMRHNKPSLLLTLMLMLASVPAFAEVAPEPSEQPATCTFDGAAQSADDMPDGVVAEPTDEPELSFAQVLTPAFEGVSVYPAPCLECEIGVNGYCIHECWVGSVSCPACVVAGTCRCP